MPDLTALTHRTQLGTWLNAHGLTGRMAEIGVAFGGYAQQVLSYWHGSEYWLIDPWEMQPANIYKERTHGIDYDTWFRQVVDLAAHDARARILRMYSVEAAAQFADGYFDCVYIDGNHCREAVEADLAAWWPKVKSGGLFCGHDCYDVVADGHYCEVRSTLTDWEKRTGLVAHVTACTSWWVIKP